MTLPDHDPKRSMSEAEKLASLIADAQVVVDSVTMDDSGQLIGQIWMGGNGGLLSNDTIKAVDKLRSTIRAIKATGQPHSSVKPGQDT
jgi:hypothetical protein